MKVTINNSEVKVKLTAQDMKTGDVGRSVEGEIILRHYGGFVSLSDPQNNWGENFSQILSQIYPKGTKIEMEVE